MPEPKLTLLSVSQLRDSQRTAQQLILERARSAQPVWDAFTLRQRRRQLWPLRGSLKKLAPQLAQTISAGLGQDETQAMAHQVLPAAMMMSTVLRRGRRLLRRRWPLPATLANFNKITRLERCALGVTALAAYDPRGFALSLGRAVASLLTGNTILLFTGPADNQMSRLWETWLSAVALPAGVVSLCEGSSQDAAFWLEKGALDGWLGENLGRERIPSPNPAQRMLLAPDADPSRAAAVLCSLAGEAIENLEVQVHWSLERSLLLQLLDHGPAGARILPCIKVVRDVASAVARLGEQGWGQVASVWSLDHIWARKIAFRLPFETVYINDHQPPQVLPELPGGWLLGPRPNVTGLAGVLMQVTRCKAVVEETGQGFFVQAFKGCEKSGQDKALQSRLDYVLADSLAERIKRLLFNR